MTPSVRARGADVGMMLLAILLLLPHAFSPPKEEDRWVVGFPRVYSGDEPHYLVFVHSLQRDGDLELGNNYEAVHRGSAQAGENHRFGRLDHHSVWMAGREKAHWSRTYETESDAWQVDAEGRPVPTLRANPSVRPAPGHPEYPNNFPGLAILLAALLFPLRGGPWLEPAAVMSVGLATVGAAFAFRALLARFAVEPTTASAIAVIAFCGTPLWHYGRTLFPEPYLALCFTLAFACGLCREPSGRATWIAGLSMAIAILIKPPSAVFGIPLGIHLLARRGALGAVPYALPCALACVAVLGINLSLFASPWVSTSTFWPGNPLSGLFGVIASPERGILFVAPITLLLAPGWATLARRFRAESAVIAASVVAYGTVIVCFDDWAGGYAYGPRYVVALLPVLCVGLAGLRPQTWGPTTKLGLAVLVALSIAVNGTAAIGHWEWWGRNPLLAAWASFV